MDITCSECKTTKVRELGYKLSFNSWYGLKNKAYCELCEKIVNIKTEYED